MNLDRNTEIITKIILKSKIHLPSPSVSGFLLKRLMVVAYLGTKFWLAIWSIAANLLCYPGKDFVLLRSCFWAKNSPFFRCQTRKVFTTTQQWSLWLYTKHLMDMFPPFWIRRPSTFGKYSIFHHLQEFSINNLSSKNAILFIFAWPKRP